MTRRVGTVLTLLLLVACMVTVSGCAGTTREKSNSEPNSPELIRKEIAEIDNDILNLEEVYKAALTALQMEEDSDTRREINRQWVELEHLRSRKAALEERLAELEALGIR